MKKKENSTSWARLLGKLVVELGVCGVSNPRPGGVVEWDSVTNEQPRDADATHTVSGKLNKVKKVEGIISPPPPQYKKDLSGPPSNFE